MEKPSALAPDPGFGLLPDQHADFPLTVTLSPGGWLFIVVVGLVVIIGAAAIALLVARRNRRE
jgi:hypothetical protein